MKKMRFFSLLLTAVILLSSCGGAGTSDGTADSSAVANGTTELGTEIEGEPLVSEAGAVDASEIEFKGKDIYSDYTGGVKISLFDTSEAGGAGYTMAAGKVSITADGTYILSGKLSDGQIVVDAPKDADVRLVLCGVDIYCSYSAPIFVNSADKVIISLPEGTQNRLEDKATSTLSDGTEITAALHSREGLSINGSGK
ncbi:MAG: carbohydrate-binding domain-containing protein, partial [Clostridia bacterium]|nr:carbohydrate-binding domain-containing protein [Clostridia bacterium]